MIDLANRPYATLKENWRLRWRKRFGTRHLVIPINDQKVLVEEIIQNAVAPDRKDQF